MTDGMPAGQMTDAEIAEELAHHASQFRAGHVDGTGLPALNFATVPSRRNELVNERARRTATKAPETK